MEESLLTPFSTWHHPATRSTYTVLGVSVCSTNGPRCGKERVVVYLSHTYSELHHREITEFLDGRFRPGQVPRESS